MKALIRSSIVCLILLGGMAAFSLESGSLAAPNLPCPPRSIGMGVAR